MGGVLGLRGSEGREGEGSWGRRTTAINTRGNGAHFTGCARGGVNWVVSGGPVEMEAGGRDSPGDHLSVAFKGW